MREMTDCILADILCVCVCTCTNILNHANQEMYQIFVMDIEHLNAFAYQKLASVFRLHLTTSKIFSTFDK